MHRDMDKSTFTTTDTIYHTLIFDHRRLHIIHHTLCICIVYYLILHYRRLQIIHLTLCIDVVYYLIFDHRRLHIIHHTLCIHMLEHMINIYDYRLHIYVLIHTLETYTKH